MAAGAKVISVPAGEDFQFPTDDLCKAVTPRTRLIAIANPNNPTGTVAPERDLLQIARSAPGAAVLVDEAYFEFYGQTCDGCARELPNLFVARTFSKAYGLAGLRIGILMGDRGTDAGSAAGQFAVQRKRSRRWLACRRRSMISRISTNMSVKCASRGAKLERALEAAGIQFWPSRGEFRPGAGRRAHLQFVEHMRRRGILVRDRSGDPGCEGCVRITLGPREHTDRLLAAAPGNVRGSWLGQGVSRR